MGNRSGTPELKIETTAIGSANAAKPAARAVAASAPATNESVWLREALALFRKDVRAELRTKVAVSSVGLFALSALMLIALATSTLKDAVSLNGRGDPLPSWDAASRFGMLWVLLCFAAFAGLSHSFVHEEQTGTTTALRLNMSPTGVYAGKLLYNLVLVLCIALVVTPLYMGVVELGVGQPLAFALTMLNGCIGLAASATFVAALAAKSRGTGALYGALGLPMLLAFLVLLLNAARTFYNPAMPALRVVKDVGSLLSFGVLLIALSALTFHYVWED